MKIVQDYKDLLVLLEAHCVDYLLIGGYAVGLYGYTRATVDLDIWVRRSLDNARKVERVLAEFGFPLNNIKVEDFTDENAIFHMGLPPNRLDILTSISGVEFDLAFSRKKRALLGGIEINIISLADLKINKLASARYKDLNDLQELNKNTSE